MTRDTADFSSLDIAQLSDMLLCPRPGGIKRWWCLTSDVCLFDVYRVHPVGGRRVRPAGWMARIGWSDPARPAWFICRCALPLQAWAGAYRGGRPPTACYTTRCHNDQWIPYLFTARSWPFWQRVVIGERLPRGVRKNTTCCSLHEYVNSAFNTVVVRHIDGLDPGYWVAPVYRLGDAIPSLQLQFSSGVTVRQPRSVAETEKLQVFAIFTAAV